MASLPKARLLGQAHRSPDHGADRKTGRFWILSRPPPLRRVDRQLVLVYAPGHPHVTENGPVTILSVPVDRRDEARLHRDVQSIAPDAVCTTRDLRAPNSAYQSGPPKRLRVLHGIGRPVRWHRLQLQKEDGTADERILD